MGSGGTVELGSLSGGNGFVLNGIDGGDASGWSVSGVGDINGDGIDDLIIGAFFADPNGDSSGESYVVFGGAVGSGGTVELGSLNRDGTVERYKREHPSRKPSPGMLLGCRRRRSCLCS